MYDIIGRITVIIFFGICLIKFIKWLGIKNKWWDRCYFGE